MYTTVLQVSTAESDVQKPKVIIAKKELTSVLLSFDPFRNGCLGFRKGLLSGDSLRHQNGYGL